MNYLYNAELTNADAAASWPLSGDPSLPIAERVPAIVRQRNWGSWLGPGVSLAIVAAVIFQVRGLDLDRVWRMVPGTASFWLLFAAFYLVAPASEWLIFRRLWRLPASGMFALLRKMVGNEILLGYSGEVYFYGWARRHGELTAAPFGAIKDTTILSAAVGNVATLAMLALAWPLFGTLHLGLEGHVVLWSVATVIVTSMITMLLRHRLFSLGASDLRFIAWVHLARTVIKMTLTACLWHVVMPGVAVSWWLLLSALRMVISRLPLLPNKDLVFAGLAVFLIGRDAELSDLMAMLASLILATHLLVGGALGIADIAHTGRTR